MDELASILERRTAAGDDAVLATVVHVRGSAYRRPGARMLVAGNGARTGTISGGCLETEVARKAWWWTDGGAAVRVFDNSKEDAAQAFGLGCNGVITVLLERARSAEVVRMLDFLAERRRSREACVVATVVRATEAGRLALGGRVLVAHPGAVGQGDPMLASAVASAAQQCFAECRSRLLRMDEADVFVEWIGPPLRLFVFGSGHDVVPLVSMAGMLGWQVTVADVRAERVAMPDLPPTCQVVTLPMTAEIDGLDLGPADAAVLMTHNYPLDAELLPQLLARSPRYLGLLGPRTRAEKLFAETGAGPIPDAVHAPVGLALGGDQPETIALAIAAEIQAVLHQQPAGFLRSRNRPIHEPPVELGDAAEASAGPVVAPTCGLAHA